MKTMFFFFLRRLCLVLILSAPYLTSLQAQDEEIVDTIQRILFKGEFLEDIPAARYVWAKSGLTLRKAPRFNAEKITVLPYGTAVEVIDYPDYTIEYSEYCGEIYRDINVKEHRLATIKGNNQNTFYLKSYWVKVQVGKQKGFLFNGYLSEMLPFKSPEKLEAGMDWREKINSIRHYAEEAWGKIGIDSTKYSVKSSNEKRKVILFGNGAVYYDYYYHHNNVPDWIIPNISFQDVYLLSNYFLDIESPHADGFRWEDNVMEFSYDLTEGYDIIRLKYIDELGGIFIISVHYESGMCGC